MSTRLFPDWQIASTDSEFTYGTGWTQNQSDDDGHNPLKYAWAENTGSTATLTPAEEFKTAFLFIYVGKDAGNMNIYVDDKLVKTHDCYLYLDGTNTMKNACIRVDAPSFGTHVIKIEAAGSRNPASTRNKIGITRAIIRDESTSKRRSKTILVFGDSNTASSTGWADRVVKSDIASLNIGTQLDFLYATRPGGVSLYIDTYGAAEIDAKRAGGVVAMLGTNNAGIGTLRNNDSVVNSLRILNKECKKRNLPLMICTILPRNDATFYVTSINSTIRQLAAEEDIQIFDVHNVIGAPGTSSPFNSDGIHLDVYGHEIVGHAFFDALSKPTSRFKDMFIS